MKCKVLIIVLILLCSTMVFSQKAMVSSPNQKIKIGLYNQHGQDIGSWYLKVTYNHSVNSCVAIPQIDLGLICSSGDYSKDLRFRKANKPLLINEQYTALHGKRSQRSNTANQVIVSFENSARIKLNLIIRAYNDGVAFRYEFPEKGESCSVVDELTAYTIPDGTRRWLEKFNPANEGYYREYEDGKVQQEWGYPALFLTSDSTTWYLIHEADLDRNYCGSKLSNTAEQSSYKITFPDEWNGRRQGEPEPVINLPWKSPWRVIIMGSLADILESTLIDDVSTPSVLKATDWIEPGLVSWNYWSHNHGTKDYQVVCDFTDLAASMGWPYTLLDWEWDSMSNGGDLEDAVEYIHSKGIKPFIWYNSGGEHTWVSATPKDRMLTHKNRIEEFSRLQKMGFSGVKVDFFESEKQDMINYYLDILEDAAQYKMMVYFHGCLVPRGWARTYPHLMTYEGVRGAEWYNNVPDFTMEAPVHNTILPFTRNVVGSMDYTPVTFTNSQNPHITSYGHELALSVMFESALQHMADRPEGYYELADAAKIFLRDVPTAWDDIKLLDGYPGKDVIIARLKGESWYIAGINAEIKEKQKDISLDFLPEGPNYKLTLIADGDHDKALFTRYIVVDNKGSVNIRMLRRGGFAGVLTPIYQTNKTNSI
jgi:alpha-glucosidase